MVFDGRGVGAGPVHGGYTRVPLGGGCALVGHLAVVCGALEAEEPTLELCVRHVGEACDAVDGGPAFAELQLVLNV